MKIIGHRGARGTELENSLASIQAALALDLDAIEFDIHRTRDDQLVVMHDATTKRTAGEDVRIADVTLDELRHVRLQNEQAIPTLEEVLQLAGDHALYIDIKDEGTVPLLLQLLKQYPAPQITVVSRLVHELTAVRAERPDIPAYLYFLKAEHPLPRPIHMVHVARRAGITGLALDKLIINPITYRLAVRSGLRMYCYPIQSLRGARLLHFLYPRVDIMASRPEKINRTTFAKYL